MKHKIKTTIILSTLAVAVIHIINKCITSAALLKHMLNADVGKYFNWRFGKIFYTKTGSGNPVLLIHDLTPFSSSYEWNEVVKKLSKQHTVYTVDLLGCGRSEKPNLTYTNFLYVQLITDFIKKVIGQKTDVVATGISSSFAIMACHNDTDLFNKIFMVNPEKISKLNGIPGKRSKMTKFLMDLPIIGTAIYNMIINRNSLEYHFTEQNIYNPFRLQAKYINAYYESAHLGGSGGKYLLSSLNGLYLNVNILHALKEINNSIFIIGGTKLTDIENTITAYTDINPSIEVAYVKDTKTLPQIECADNFLEQISIFL